MSDRHEDALVTHAASPSRHPRPAGLMRPWLAAILFTTASIAHPIQATAQDNNAAKIDALVDMLRKTPVSQLDLGLLNIKLRVLATFAVEMPKALSKGSFQFVDVDYRDDTHQIFIEVSHRAADDTVEELSDECKADVELIYDAIAPNTKAPSNSSEVRPEERDEMCLPVTSDFTSGGAMDAIFAHSEVTNPGANLCTRVTLWASVWSEDYKHGVYCSRKFFDRVTVVSVYQ